MHERVAARDDYGVNYTSQLVLQPTRISNILDIILTIALTAHDRRLSEPPVSISVHCLIVCAITATPPLKFAAKSTAHHIAISVCSLHLLIG